MLAAGKPSRVTALLAAGKLFSVATVLSVAPAHLPLTICPPGSNEISWCDHVPSEDGIGVKRTPIGPSK